MPKTSFLLDAFTYVYYNINVGDVPTLKLMYGFPTIDGYLNLGNLLEDRYKEVGPYLLGPENSGSVLELYESQYPGNARKITNGIFIKWLQGFGKPVTWDTLVDCLEKFSISCIVKVVVDSFKEDKESVWASYPYMQTWWRPLF